MLKLVRSYLGRLFLLLKFPLLVKIIPYQQEFPHTCAVACLRIVAEYFGVLRIESELIPLCETTLDGTTPENLAYAARHLGLSATITYDEPAILSESLSRQQPVIVFVGIPSPQIPEDIDIHAVVVTDLSLQEISFIDPLDGLEHTLQRTDFFKQWENAFHIAILIGPI